MVVRASARQCQSSRPIDQRSTAVLVRDSQTGYRRRLLLEAHAPTSAFQFACDDAQRRQIEVSSHRGQAFAAEVVHDAEDAESGGHR